jgi:spermidine synthase
VNDADLIGTELLCDLWTDSPVGETGDVVPVLTAAITASGATLLDLFVKQFEPAGVSAVAIIGESHIAIHTWPNLGFVSVEAFTCSAAVDLDAIVKVVVAAWEPSRVTSQIFERGKNGPSGTTPRYFSEVEPGSPGTRSYAITKLIDERTSQFQDILVFESPVLGRVLAIDNIVQVAEVDAYVYHEMLVHPALCAHRAPRSVVIVGGGDGLAAAEVLKHDVESVTVLDLDQAVVDACRPVFPGAASFDDPRVTVRIGDAYDSLFDVGPIDVLLSDMTDPIGQAARFFEEEFLGRVASVLGPDGVLAMQSESLHFHPDTVRTVRAAARRQFAHAATVTGSMATYPGAWWTFTLGCNGKDPRVASRCPDLDTRFYDPRSHEWFFIPDNVVDRLLATGPEAPRGRS